MNKMCLTHLRSIEFMLPRWFARSPRTLISMFGYLVLLSFSLPAIATSSLPPSQFSIPKSTALDYTNLLIGNGGYDPNFTGGMIPSVSPPFAMTRWVPQTQIHYVSSVPYNWTHHQVMGFVGTRQPAIWMGESAPIAVCPGVGPVVVDFEKRALSIIKNEKGDKKEVVSAAYYSVELDDGHGGTVLVEQTATSRVAQLRFNFSGPHDLQPYILLEVARPSVITSTPSNISYPAGSVYRPNNPYEICGYSSERQDSIIAPISIAPFSTHFKGYFCARFESGHPPVFGANQNDSITYPFEQGSTVQGPLLRAYALFPKPDPSKETVITLRVGTSFISEEQARTNIDAEIPDRSFPAPPPGVTDVPSERPTPAHLQQGTIENTAYLVRKSWTEILDRIEVLPYVNGKHQEDDPRAIVDLGVFWTGVVHTLQYPNEQDEGSRYYSGYDNKVHINPAGGRSYSGYSIWDTYRAAWAWQVFFVPKKVPGMIWSMLEDYQQGGWLPMWKNIVETSIMIGTHADSLIAEAVMKNISAGFDLDLAWEAVWKDATVSPENDGTTLYADREENVDFEVRAGLSSVYQTQGWVADDVHSESASRTLAYAYDDFAAYVLADNLKKGKKVTDFLHERAMRTPFSLFNDQTGFMEARNTDGSWAGDTRGWTEGDKWAYSFDVVHAIPELIKRRGGKVGFVKSLEAHFEGGHNEHTNEPSHHIPYLYALSGAAFKTQERVREVALANYNNTPNGLAGNEDCGQMSAWYIFSSMGFYPVNPVSGEYVVGSPFFEKVALDLDVPSANGWHKRKLTITAPGARTKPYVKSLSINGMKIDRPVIKHSQLVGWENDNDTDEVRVEFEMSDKIAGWGNERDVLASLGVKIPLETEGDADQEAVFHEEL